MHMQYEPEISRDALWGLGVDGRIILEGILKK